MKKNALAACVWLLFFFWGGAMALCDAAPKDIIKERSKTPALNLKSYDFNPDSDLMSRTGKIPAHVLDYMKSYDDRPDYAGHAPGPEEMATIKKCLDLAPPDQIKVLKKRLLGFYFINDFLGNGFTEYVMEESGQTYCFIIYNSKTLTQSLEQLLEEKEKTCFVDDGSGAKISFDFGGKHAGFLWAFLHEAAHVEDYAGLKTPYVEDSFAKAKGLKGNDSRFTRGVWKAYKEYEKGVVFPYQKQIKFYGLGGDPVLELRKAPAVYSALSKTPFPSLYAATNWAEDWADFRAFAHMTRELGLPYIIRVEVKGKLYTYSPMKFKRVKSRT